ncbi:MAG: hypothetical protein M1840_007475 [Geoglossum simile]|nr:MAG: hypothetical protein M1840_007475 [Geoglossum simile]
MCGSPRSTNKSEFFERLYNLDQLSDDDIKELSKAEYLLERGKKVTQAGCLTEAPRLATMPKRSRTKSSPTPPPWEQPIVGRRARPEKKSNPKGTRTSLSKKKKELPLQMVPESRQIFKGLKFYFLPESDVSLARRIRKRRAMEHGADLVKEWTDGITHIIADKYLTYQDIIKYLKIPSLPETVILVNEIYTLDCIQYRLIVNPTHPYYQVDRGDPSKTGGATTSETQSSEDHSLLLKPAKRRNNQPPETPPRDIDFSENNLARQLPTTPLRQPVFLTQIKDKTANDALDDAIKEAQVLKHLFKPIGTDDEDEVAAQAPTDRDTDDEEVEVPLKKLKGGRELKNNSFQCMHKHDGREHTTNPNMKTIATLQEMSDYYARIQDTWRPIAYRKAIATLRKQNHKITTAEEAVKLPFIGSRLALKIEEIAWTNRLRRLENTKLEDSDKLLEKFLGIYGVGFSQASRWISQGYKNFEDLLLHVQLTDNQKIGIEHYEDFKTRIPRAEVEEHGNIVTSSAQGIDPQLQVVIMGSYRRGAETCGDIDFMITKPGASIYELRNILLDELIPSLFAQDFLQVGLAVTSKTNGTKWHGASCLPGRDGAKWRRVDFLLVPTEEMGAALIYFTGNDIFNRSIRLLASKKGMRLNQHGLWKDVIRGRNRERMTQGTLLEGKSERRIFEILGALPNYSTLDSSLCLLCSSYRVSFTPGHTVRDASSASGKTPPGSSPNRKDTTGGPALAQERDTEQDFIPKPLARPLGLSNPPEAGENTGVDMRTWRQRREDFFNYHKHLEKRKLLTKKISTPYFREWTNMRYHKGKTFLSNPRLFRADRALYFPNIYGKTLLSPGHGTDTTPVLKDNISIVSIFSSAWAERQVQTFVSETQNPELSTAIQESGGAARRVDVNVEENALKAGLIRLFMPSIRRRTPRERHGRYFVVRRGISEEIRDAIGFLNGKVGYVYLLDGECKIRWAGSGRAEREEKESLARGVKRLVDEWRRHREGGADIDNDTDEKAKAVASA